MFLFKNIKNRVLRIGLNITIYGCLGFCLFIVLVVMVPDPFSKLAGFLWEVSIFLFIIGAVVSIISYFFGIVFSKKRKNNPNATSPKCPSCGNSMPSHVTKCFECDWIESRFSDKKEIFKMVTPNGQTHNFVYSGHSRFSPNRSMRSGYGSDDWFYLCKENTKYYLLQFTDNAEFGTGWMATELLSDDYDKLINEGADFWGSIACSKERKRIYAIRLTEVDSVRHLLPVSSRCCGKLTDKDYLR